MTENRDVFTMSIKELRIYRLIRKMYYNLYNARLMAKYQPKGVKGAVIVMIYSLYGGGAERVASLLANGFSKAHPVIVMCYEKKEKTYELAKGIKEIILPPPFKGSWESKQQLTEQFVRKVKQSSKAIASISLMYAMNKLNVRTKGAEKVICSERNNPAKREPERMQEIEEIYAAADCVVFQSSIVQSLFNETVRNHSAILPNPVTVTCERSGSPNRRIVNVGRLHPQKNQKLLINAFAEFEKSHPAYTLSFYGDGILREDLEHERDALGLHDKVFFHGNVENIHEAISDAEMFVLSSDYEGFSNALLESMIMGIPSISTSCEGSTDVIRHMHNGMLTKVGDLQDLIDAMTYLADHPEQREEMGRQGKLIRAKFEPQAVLQQWNDLIESVNDK